MGLITEIYKVFVHLDLKTFLVFEVMYLLFLCHTPGEFFFMYFVLGSFNARHFSQFGDMMTHRGWGKREREKPASSDGLWRVRVTCVLSELSRSPVLSGSTRVDPFSLFLVSCFLFKSGTIHCSSLSLINSGFVHLLCCMFESAAKERRVQVPRHVYILKTHNLNRNNRITNLKNTFFFNWMFSLS